MHVRVLKLIITPGSPQSSSRMKSNILFNYSINTIYWTGQSVGSSVMIRSDLFNNSDCRALQTVGWKCNGKLFTSWCLSMLTKKLVIIGVPNGLFSSNDNLLPELKLNSYQWSPFGIYPDNDFAQDHWGCESLWWLKISHFHKYIINSQNLQFFSIYHDCEYWSVNQLVLKINTKWTNNVYSNEKRLISPYNLQSAVIIYRLRYWNRNIPGSLGGGIQGAVSIQRYRLTSIGISMLKIRRSHVCLIFNMGSQTWERRSLYWGGAQVLCFVSLSPAVALTMQGKRVFVFNKKWF